MHTSRCGGGQKHQVLTYSGEIFNYRELARLLSSHGVSLRTTSDTEVVLEMCKKFGVEKTLPQLNGMFAFVFYDTKQQKGWVARDRFGEKPLYYYVKDGAVAFSSSVMALSQGYGVRTPDLDSYQVYLSTRGIILPDKTFFKDIQSFPAGHLLSFDPGTDFGHGGAAPKPYLDVADFVSADEQTSLASLSRAEVADLTRQCLQAAVRSHSVCDVPVGILLSGGIDSSIVYWYLKDIYPDLATFTNLSPGMEVIPKAVVPELLARKPSRSVEVEAKKEDYPAQLDEFIRWSGFAPPWGGGPPMGALCAAAQADGIKVLMSGNCIDELGGGFLSYRRSVENFDGDEMALGEQVGIYSRELLFRPDALDEYMAFNLGVRAECLDHYDTISDPKDRFIQASLLHDSKVFLQSCTLLNSDAFSMWKSVELRTPFLDHDFVRLTLNLPAGKKVAYGSEGSGLKQFLTDLTVEDIGTFMEHPKEGSRNYSIAVSNSAYWDLSRFALSDVFPIPHTIDRKLLFRLICLEMFHQNFICGGVRNWTDLLSEEGRSLFCP